MWPFCGLKNCWTWSSKCDGKEFLQDTKDCKIYLILFLYRALNSGLLPQVTFPKLFNMLFLNLRSSTTTLSRLQWNSDLGLKVPWSSEVTGMCHQASLRWGFWNYFYYIGLQCLIKWNFSDACLCPIQFKMLALVVSHCSVYDRTPRKTATVLLQVV